MAQRGRATPTPADVAALASATTAEPSQISVVNDATADPVCATADWLALDTDGDGLSHRLEEDQDSDGALRSACGINAAGGQNTGQLGLASPPKVASGSRSGAFSCETKNAGPDGYAGFERSLPTQNWQPHDVLYVCVKRDRCHRGLLIQFGQASGEAWRYRIDLSAFTIRDSWLPLNDSTFQPADCPPVRRNT